MASPEYLVNRRSLILDFSCVLRLGKYVLWNCYTKLKENTHTFRTPASTSKRPLASCCEVAKTARISPDFTSKLSPDTSRVDLFSGDVISNVFT